MVKLTSISLNNSIGLVTVDDNLVHKYFTELKWEKDNVIPTGYAQLKTMYNEEILKYWTTYNGNVIVHAQLGKKQAKNDVYNNLPNTSLKTKAVEKTEIKEEKNKTRIENTQYNYSFIGYIYKVKQIGQNIVIKIHDVGWKFMQKVPMDFRKSYIAGQSLDDAFQAICEFIGVDFAYSIEDLNQYNFSADGYSIEKDGTIIEDVPTILQEFQKKDDEEEENTDETLGEDINDGINELGALPQLSNKKKKQQSNNKQKRQSNNNADTSLNSSVTNLDSDENKNEEQEEQTIDDKIEKYQEEFEDKIKDLFLGNTMYNSNITEAILDYNAITIQPKAVTSSDMSTVGGTAGATGDTSENSDSSSSSGSSSSQRLISGRSREKNGWINGQYYINGKIYLSKSYINSLSPKQAGAKRASGLRTYTYDTLEKLLWRSMGQTLR